MAWSDAARKAALEARRRRRSIMADWHYGGTPRRDPFYTSKDYRSRLAKQMKDIRARLRRGNIDYFEQQKINEVFEASGRARMHKIYYREGFRPNQALFRKQRDKAMRAGRDVHSTAQKDRENAAAREAQRQAGETRKMRKPKTDEQRKAAARRRLNRRLARSWPRSPE